MVDLSKAVQNYWKDHITKLPATAQSLEFQKGNQYRSLELGYVAVYNHSTEALDLPLFQAAVPKAESSFDEEIMALTEAKPAHDFDFIGANHERIMCHIDIPNETVIERVDTKEEDKKSEEEHELELNVSEGVHPLLLPPAPLCHGHAIFPMNCDQSLTQELSDDILTILLQLQVCSRCLTLLDRIGFNGMGAGSTVNQLHFHLLFADSLYQNVPESGNTDAIFPIEMADKLPFYETSLQHKSSEELDMFTVGVMLMETFNFGVPTIILQPREAITKDNADQAQESLSHVCAAITDLFMANGVPYNLLITDKGMTFYLSPRKKDVESADYGLGVFDIAGAFYVLGKEHFDKINYKYFSEYCKANVGLAKEEFAGLKKMIVQKLESEYKGSVNS